MDDEQSYRPTPTLMRAARGVYAQAIRAELHAIGIDDLPKNGTVVLARVADGDGAGLDLPAELGVTKQAVSQVVDALVTRGYLERHPDDGDRRRVVLELTERGVEAANAAYRGVEAVDRQLEERMSAADIAAMRSGLIALSEIKTTDRDRGVGLPRPRRDLRTFAPIFRVEDVGAGLAHYRSLGFHTIAYEEGDDYGFANRDGISLHLAAASEERPAGTGSTYLYVRDADALYAEWTQPGIGGHTHSVEPTPYRLREGAHFDPDGNLIRFGSPLDE